MLRSREDTLLTLLAAPSDLTRVALGLHLMASPLLVRLEMRIPGREPLIVSTADVDRPSHVLRLAAPGNAELTTAFTGPWPRALEADLAELGEALVETTSPYSPESASGGLLAALLRHECRLERDPVPTGVLVVRVTDSTGRELDQPLQDQLARLVRDVVRDRDEIHFDNSLLGVIVPNAAVQVVEEIAWRLRIGISTTALRSGDGQPVDLLPSVGAASWPMDGARLTDAALVARLKLGEDAQPR